MGVLQTNQRELDAFYAMALPGFLEYLRARTERVWATWNLLPRWKG